MSTNKKFGRGLASLLGEKITAGNQREIALDLIIPSQSQPRRDFGTKEMEELLESVKKYGILQPILVRQRGDGYEIIAGERRYRTAKLAQLQTIPAIVRDCGEEELAGISIVENVQRKNLSSLEEAIAYRQLMDKYGYDQSTMAAVVGKSRSHIANLLRILQLPLEVIRYLQDGQLDLGHAKILVGHPEADELARRVVVEHMSVRALEHLLRTQKTKKTMVSSKDVMASRQEQLARKIPLHCRLDYDCRRGKAVLHIHFCSLEELDNFIGEFPDADGRY
jgi:ParB family chromosome partitioning protein